MLISPEYGERILGTCKGQPVLLHGDFCFGNLLFDPETWRISGLIDPLDAEWGERKLDLVNLINGYVLHFELLNRYREAVDVSLRKRLIAISDGLSQLLQHAGS